MVEVFKEAKRVLRKDGTLWLNLGDSYATQHTTGTTDDKTGWKHGKLSKGHQGRAGGVGNGIKPKDLVGIPWRVAFALQADGWYLRSDIIWSKPNPMPESVTDRPTKAHEYIFLMSKSPSYYYDAEAIKEKAISGYKSSDFIPDSNKDLSCNNTGSSATKASFNNRNNEIVMNRNKRSVWHIATTPYSGAHFATFPEDLIKPCILAGCPEGGMVLDPFFGAGTTGVVCKNWRREYLGIELSPDYIKLAQKRLANVQVPFL